MHSFFQPADMTVKESHDIGLNLQLALEKMKSVERAFVHIDYRARTGIDEHDWREIWAGQRTNNSTDSDSDGL